jgi:hypothetical protein
MLVVDLDANERRSRSRWQGETPATTRYADIEGGAEVASVTRTLVIGGATVLVWVVPALGQGPFIYAQKGQSPQQQQQDTQQCQGWAMQQSGVNPSQPAAPPPPPPSTAPQGQGARGAARGAAVGAVGGAIAGDAGKGAAIGAATGMMIGGMQRRQDRRNQEAQYNQAVSQQQTAQAQGADAFNRALAACLEARGYTVK